MTNKQADLSSELQPTATVPALKLDPSLLLNFTKAQKTKKKSKAHRNVMKMREKMWPDLDEDILWQRSLHDGYSSIPRTMSIMMNIIDDLAKKHTGKSVPAGKTYFGLWCRVWDENMLIIENEASYAVEAGYLGERNVSTWRKHMKTLHELGFIDVRSGAYGPYNFILLLNPYLIMKKLESEISTQSFNLLLQRAIEIGADKDLAK